MESITRRKESHRFTTPAMCTTKTWTNGWKIPLKASSWRELVIKSRPPPAVTTLIKIVTTVHFNYLIHCLRMRRDGPQLTHGWQWCHQNWYNNQFEDSWLNQIILNFWPSHFPWSINRSIDLSKWMTWHDNNTYDHNESPCFIIYLIFCVAELFKSYQLCVTVSCDSNWSRYWSSTKSLSASQ